MHCLDLGIREKKYYYHKTQGHRHSDPEGTQLLLVISLGKSTLAHSHWERQTRCQAEQLFCLLLTLNISFVFLSLRNICLHKSLCVGFYGGHTHSEVVLWDWWDHSLPRWLCPRTRCQTLLGQQTSTRDSSSQVQIVIRVEDESKWSKSKALLRKS